MKRRAFVIGRIVAGIAISVGLAWLTARGLDWSLVFESFRSLSIPTIALAGAIFIAASYLRAVRWRLLFVNEKITTNRLFIVQNVGIGLNNLVPIRIASEAAQLAKLSIRDRLTPSVTLATLGMERVLDVLASALIMAAAFFLIPEMRDYGIYVWGALAFAIICVALVRLTAWSGDKFAWLRRIPFLLSFVESVRDLERERARLAASFALSVAYWILVGVTAWIISISFHLSITPVIATMIIMATIFFATAIPAAPSAIGTFEFAVVYLLGMFGVSHEPAFGFAVITHAVFFLPPTLMAALFLPREGIDSISKLRTVLSGRVQKPTDAA